MTLTSFLIRIIFLAIPGILGSSIYRRLKGNPKQKDWEDFREIAMFSLFSYLAYGSAVDITNRFGTGWTFTSLEAFFDEKIPLSWTEITIASGIGILLAFVATLIYTLPFRLNF